MFSPRPISDAADEKFNPIEFKKPSLTGEDIKQALAHYNSNKDKASPVIEKLKLIYAGLIDETASLSDTVLLKLVEIIYPIYEGLHLDLEKTKKVLTPIKDILKKHWQTIGNARLQLNPPTKFVKMAREISAEFRGSLAEIREPVVLSNGFIACLVSDSGGLDIVNLEGKLIKNFYMRPDSYMFSMSESRLAVVNKNLINGINIVSGKSVSYEFKDTTYIFGEKWRHVGYGRRESTPIDLIDVIAETQLSEDKTYLVSLLTFKYNDFPRGRIEGYPVPCWRQYLRYFNHQSDTNTFLQEVSYNAGIKKAYSSFALVGNNCVRLWRADGCSDVQYSEVAKQFISHGPTLVSDAWRIGGKNKSWALIRNDLSIPITDAHLSIKPVKFGKNLYYCDSKKQVVALNLMNFEKVKTEINLGAMNEICISDTGKLLTLVSDSKKAVVLDLIFFQTRMEEFFSPSLLKIISDYAEYSVSSCEMQTTFPSYQITNLDNLLVLKDELTQLYYSLVAASDSFSKLQLEALEFFIASLQLPKNDVIKSIEATKKAFPELMRSGLFTAPTAVEELLDNISKQSKKL